MSMSLRDQLIQAGLGTKKQAKQATPPPKKAPSRHQPPSISPEKIAAMKAQAAKNARDQELNRKQQEKAAAKARRAEVKQLIEQHRLPPVVSEVYFNFADGNRLARLAVTPELGVEHDLRHPLAVAQIDEDAAPVIAVGGHPAEEDDRRPLLGCAEGAAVVGALQLVDESGHVGYAM